MSNMRVFVLTFISFCLSFYLTSCFIKEEGPVVGPNDIKYKVTLPKDHILISASINRGNLSYTTQDTISKTYHIYREGLEGKLILKGEFKSYGK